MTTVTKKSRSFLMVLVVEMAMHKTICGICRGSQNTFKFCEKKKHSIFGTSHSTGQEEKGMHGVCMAHVADKLPDFSAMTISYINFKSCWAYLNGF